MTLVLSQRPKRLPLLSACRVLGLNRSSVYARQKRRTAQSDATTRKHCRQPRALSPAERDHVLAVLNSLEFCDQPPYEVYKALLKRGEYLCSVSTMYRLLREQKAHGERRQQRPAQHHAVPRLLASQPNQVWTWDITKLPIFQRGSYLSLYVILDLYSRFVLAWMVSRKENSALARQLFDEALARYRIGVGQLTLHQDRGSPMIAHGYLDMLGESGVRCTHSRPRVSNDNPFSESQFKTAKYQPDYPGRFESVSHARQWYKAYFDWYNFQHHHCNLAGYTPSQVFTGEWQEIEATRQAALDAKYAAHPERFVAGRPITDELPKAVAINPIRPEESVSDYESAVNFPTLSAARKIAERFNDKNTVTSI